MHGVVALVHAADKAEGEHAVYLLGGLLERLQHFLRLVQVAAELDDGAEHALAEDALVEFAGLFVHHQGGDGVVDLKFPDKRGHGHGDLLDVLKAGGDAGAAQLDGEADGVQVVDDAGDVVRLDLLGAAAGVLERGVLMLAEGVAEGLAVGARRLEADVVYGVARTFGVAQAGAALDAGVEVYRHVPAGFLYRPHGAIGDAFFALDAFCGIYVHVYLLCQSCMEARALTVA